MEKDFHIPTPDGKVIYGKLRGELGEKLAIFVHGLTAHMDNHRFYNGARYLEGLGFANFRFNLYDDLGDARKLVDCTLKIHADDLGSVVRHFKDVGVKSFGVIGHSYGAPTILLAEPNQFRAVVLWDPSYQVEFEDLEHVPELSLYRSLGGVQYLFGEEMINEARRLDWDGLTQGLEVPLKVICAGEGILVEGGRRYCDVASGETDLVVVKGAGHSFNEDGAAEQLFEATAGWLKTYL